VKGGEETWSDSCLPLRWVRWTKSLVERNKKDQEDPETIHKGGFLNITGIKVFQRKGNGCQRGNSSKQVSIGEGETKESILKSHKHGLKRGHHEAGSKRGQREKTQACWRKTGRIKGLINGGREGRAAERPTDREERLWGLRGWGFEL